MRVQARDQAATSAAGLRTGTGSVDASPRPNGAHAAWGRRLHRLDPDPATADTVRWIFARRLAGGGLTHIARELNDRGLPCPSAADPDRNQHRSGSLWTLQTIASILSNPRYTGRQVWNRQPHDCQRLPDGDLVDVQHWAHASDWVISARPAHPALASEADFVAAQTVRAARATAENDHRAYQLTELLRCGICGRRLDAHWVNDRPGYRCRHGQTSAASAGRDKDQREPYVYVREDELLHDSATTLTGPSDPPVPIDQIPALLTRRGITIVCDRTRRALTPASPPSTGG
jgi:site-specific DNA recombinase